MNSDQTTILLAWVRYQFRTPDELGRDADEQNDAYH